MRLPNNRNLFTGDSTYLFFEPEIYHPSGGPYTARVFHDHIATLAGYGFDAYLCNPQAQGNWWPSKRTPHIYQGYRRGDREFVRSQVACDGVIGPPEAVEAHIDLLLAAADRYLDLLDAGVDWPAEIACACRQHGMSPWVTVRMNDVHACTNPDSFINCPPFREPANRLRGQWSGTWPGHPQRIWSYFAGLDYTKPAVREFFLTVIAELVEDYDFEGLELDWLRNPICCEPVASPEDIEMMIDFHRQVRELTLAAGRRHNRHFALGLRIPPNFGLLRDIGLDVRAIAQAGLVDFVSVSNFWQTSWDLPYDQYRVELGDDVTLYGVIEAAPNWVYGFDPTTDRRGARLMPGSPEFQRGNAAGKLALGVDGLEYFNFFARDTRHESKGKPRWNYSAIADLPHLDRLRGTAKNYTLSTMIGDCWIPPFEAPEQLPAVLQPRWRRQFRLSMTAEPATCRDVFVHVVFEKRDEAPDLSVSFNDGWPNHEGRLTDTLISPAGSYTHHLPEHQALAFRFDPAVIREGWNEIMLFNNSMIGSTPAEKQANAVTIVSLEIAVR